MEQTLVTPKIVGVRFSKVGKIYHFDASKIEKIRKDTTLAEADKGTKMAAAATSAGLTAERFNAIGQGMQSDTALNQRIQAAAAAKMAASGQTPAAKQP